MVFRDWECLNNISPLLRAHRIIITERTSGCSGDCWSEYETWHSDLEEAQNYCAAFIDQEEESYSNNSHVRWEIKMEIIF